MKIKNGFTLHQIGDEHIIMHNGTGNVDFSNIISLNPTLATCGRNRFQYRHPYRFPYGKLRSRR